MTERTRDAVLARRRARRVHIVLDPEAEERLRTARAALGLPRQTTTKETS